MRTDLFAFVLCMNSNDNLPEKVCLKDPQNLYNAILKNSKGQPRKGAGKNENRYCITCPRTMGVPPLMPPCVGYGD